MNPLLRLRAAADQLRTSLWALPLALVLAALVAGSVLAQVRLPPESLLGRLVFQGSADGARALLTTVAGSMITVTGLVFTLTVVALQMASGQYSPRLLRNYFRDASNKWTLGAFVGTFAYSVAVLREFQPSASGEDVVPALAITVGMLLVLVSLGLLVYFLHHLSRSIRVEDVIRDVRNTTISVIDAVFPEPCDPGARRREIPEPPERAQPVMAPSSGYVQTFDPKHLLQAAIEHDVVVRLRPQVGEHLLEGAVFAWVWSREPDGRAPDVEALSAALGPAARVGRERTQQQDVAFGLRQLVDVGVKALSPGVNDPTTAVDAVHALSVPLSHLVRRQLGHKFKYDEDGVLRVAIPRPDFASYLALALSQVRRYGADEPVVMSAVLHVLGDLALLARTDADRDAIRRHVGLVTDAAERETRQEEDLDDVATLGRRVLDALEGAARPEPTRAG